MNRFVGFKNFTQGMLFIAIIIIGIVFVGFIIISIVGNIQLGCSSKEIKPPDIEKAQYQVYVKATRKIYYTNRYEVINGKIHILHGYYEPRNGKYIYNPSDIMLNAYYFGDVIINKR